MFSNMKQMVKIRIHRKARKEREGSSYGEPAWHGNELEVDVRVHPSLEGDPGLTKLIKTAIKEIQE